jgi:iron complex outermembrane recepter protein
VSAVAPVTVEAASRQNIVIAAGPLEQAIASLSRQSGVSIGMPGKLPNIWVKGFSGHLTPETALRRMLDGTGYKAFEVGPNAWRIEAMPVRTKKPKSQVRKTKPVPVDTPKIMPPAPPVEIVITAAKRAMPLETTPVASTVITGDLIGRFSLSPSTADVAAMVDGMALSNLGPGRNRAFLRGIGDSPFNGQTQATVATVLNDVRVNFNAPEPELQLIDIDRVELLKGPQGPLYGTGALGGVYRIVTALPKLDKVSGKATVGVESLSHGGIGGTASAVFNAPIIPDELGVRLLAYASLQPGWIDTNRSGGKNSNEARIYGGRLALRYQPAGDWTVDLLGLGQFLHVADSQYSNVDKGYRRVGVAAEPHDNDFIHGQLTISGKIRDMDFLSTTGWTRHEVATVLDASPSATYFGRPTPLLFDDSRNYDVFNQEVRLSGTRGAVRFLGGLSYLQAGSQIDGSILSGTGVPTKIGALHEAIREVAVFGDLSLALSPRWTVEAGLRLFNTSIDDERNEDNAGQRVQDKRSGVTPSLALSFQPDHNAYYYARFASAIRPKGSNAFAPLASANFGSDELQNIEVGGRWKFPDQNLSVKVELYGSLWSHIQSDYLLPNGLAATRNSGRALIFGMENSLQWRPHNSWSLEAGFDWQHARLEKPDPSLGFTSDRQLPVVAGYKAHFGLTRAFDISDWHVAAYVRTLLVGPSRLSLAPGLERRIDDLMIADAGINVRFDGLQLGLTIENLTNSGDDSFSFGNPFSIQAAEQRTPLRPRRITMRVSWSY